jgi:hypothetical protein
VAYIDRGRSFHGTYPLIDAVLPPHETHHVSAPVDRQRDVVDAVTACRMLAEAGFR